MMDADSGVLVGTAMFYRYLIVMDIQLVPPAAAF